MYIPYWNVCSSASVSSVRDSSKATTQSMCVCVCVCVCACACVRACVRVDPTAWLDAPTRRSKDFNGMYTDLGTIPQVMDGRSGCCRAIINKGKLIHI